MPKGGRKAAKKDLPAQAPTPPIDTRGQTPTALPTAEVSEKNVESKEPQTEIKQTQKYRKRVIHDNWAKYEEAIVSDDITDDCNKEENDFSFLAHRVTSLSYFQTSSEKEWDRQKLSVENIFQLDLKLLSAGLSCIPLHKRIGLEEREITKSDLERCEYFADKSQQRYQPICCEFRKSRSKEELPKDTTKHLLADRSTNSAEEHRVSSKALTEATAKTAGTNEAALNVISKRSARSPTKESIAAVTSLDFPKSLETAKGTPRSTPKPPTTVSTDDNLEDWLDNLLDD